MNLNIVSHSFPCIIYKPWIEIQSFVWRRPHSPDLGHWNTFFFRKGEVAFAWSATKLSLKPEDYFVNGFRENHKSSTLSSSHEQFVRFVIWLRSSDAARFLRFDNNHLGTFDYKRFNSLGCVGPSHKTKREQLSFNHPCNPRSGSRMGRVYVLVSSNGYEHVWSSILHLVSGW